MIQLPDREWSYSVVEAWNLVTDAIVTREDAVQGDALAQASSQRLACARSKLGDGDRSGARAVQIVATEKPMRVIDREQVPRNTAGMHRFVHAFSTEPEALLPQDVILTEDQRLLVPLPDSEIFELLAGALVSGDGWPSTRLPQVPARVAAAPSAVTSTIVDLARRPGQTPDAYLQRLAELMARREALTAREEKPTGITLDDLPGLGAAGVWGRQTVADLQAYAAGNLPWSELDRGVVLEGPPGTGKTSFAGALANSAGVAFVSASLAQWQGDRDGHLGTLCAAMCRTFQEARSKAPCILLVDEVDGFPTRALVRSDHRNYTIQVVNAFLEQLDGATDRAGVLVVAACNDASGLDPALTRPGRLERIIRLEKPDEDGLVDIARVHLAGDLQEANLKPLAMSAFRRGAVGADVENWCRGARRRARTAGRPMLLDDLIAEIGEAPPVHGPEAIWRMAVHEAGHVLACAALDASSVQEVTVDPKVGGRSATMVNTFDLYRRVPNATRPQARAKLRVALAGRAAEEIILGEPSSGAGGSADSDLARATRMAGIQVVSSGLDEHFEGLLYLGGADDQQRFDSLLLLPEVRGRVAAVLRSAYSDALDLVRRHRSGVERVAEVLVERGTLSGEEARDLLGDLGREEDTR
ncbi:AAA family ATPase [Muricoccus nepalensis]|uniref:AAA family ATPase n=1 Tax=Muricoccus nepalensis TaxID=1854500 RepID=UPI001386C6B2|nr:AAA family ATPase [Roseomonas nepalensis]